LVDRLGVTTLWLTAGLFHQVVDFAPAALSRLSQALTVVTCSPRSCGARPQCPPSGGCPGQWLRSHGGTTFTTCHRMATDATVDGAVPIGRPLPNSRVYIVDEYDDLVPPGVPGELLIGGDGVALGYHNQPELTAAAFVPDRFGPDPTRKLYRSGDRGRWRSDGTIEFLGRIDRQVKIRGFRIEPEAVERTLREHPLIVEAAADVRAVGQDRQLVAYVTPELDADSLGEVRLFLRERLPSQEIPSHIMAMDVLPLSHNGRSTCAPSWSHRPLLAGVAGSAPVAHSSGSSWPSGAMFSTCRPCDRTMISSTSVDTPCWPSTCSPAWSVSWTPLPLSTIFEAPTVRELSGVMSANGWDKPWRSLARLRTTARGRRCSSSRQGTVTASASGSGPAAGA